MFCPSIAMASKYAHLDDESFRLMKALTPGPYTFILKGTKEVPRVVLNPRRKTAGLRIPDHKICMGLLAGVEGLIISTTAKLPDGEEATGIAELFDAYENLVDVIIDDGRPFGLQHTTVLDLTGPVPQVIREGLGMEAILPFLAPLD